MFPVTNALVIVESPAKAKKIAEFLGAGYTVESSIGHIRDLPRNAAEVPKAYKNEPWARTGINVDDGFKPLYVENADKRAHIRLLKQLVKDSDELYLATDEDREGEAIAWHLIEVLNPQIPVKRMVFHEITPAAIAAAVNSPRELDRKMVDAQEARRILDRLYGYEVSPVLWKKVLPQLSAGRVQSVATRIVVQRERERMDFRAASYWSVSGTFAAVSGDTREFSASLASIDGVKLASGRDFGDDGRLAREDVRVLDESAASKLVGELEGVPYEVRSREAKPYRRRPAAPFITSTYQQEAGRKLKMSAQMAMRAAQGLYEKGYITYMRTDSTTLSETALQAARATIKNRYGTQYLPDSPRRYTKKSKNAQEAHEAIRPAGESFRSPEEVASEVPSSEARAYELIWKRTVASQMTDCTGETVQLRLGATSRSGSEVVFSASGTVISHRGFREVYEETSDGTGDENEERRLPSINEGDGVRANAPLEPEGHETTPPARYTEASLVKRLEELGVGRPSTYASIISTILDRGYVWKKVSALIPSFTAFAVVNLMERHFPNLVDYRFTAQMEDDLDKIASGTEESEPWLTRFYFGGGEGTEPGLKEKVSTRLADIDARSVNTVRLGISDDGQPIVVRVGRYGPYVQRGESDENGSNNGSNTASIPDDLPPDELTLEKALEYLEMPKAGRVLGTDPETGMNIFAKAGRFGPYVQVGTSDEQDQKPKSASLFATMTLERVTLEDALQLLSLPRTVGTDPADGEAISAQNGRYGPYVSKGSESRSLDNEEQIFTVTLEECLALLAQPKRRRGQAPKPPLRDMGEDPDTGKAMVVKDGRFGPYVTDGEYNASLRKGDTVEELTVERAAELLAERRLKGPAKKAAKRASGRKKATKKSTKKATRKRPT
ncbi:MAG: type I DNA topoisomerase [Acidimicrobiaceae bacterium]|nr:type I DNA topoisomerase [Acidimicrobiaceae bacterium]MYG56554.1 type I DNA topoisomerase [Acidimicrobiaceae bacterium]MYJ97537.1 type I DNA topoisomerase [Acidimicrobiaceae bacterium]